MGIFKRLKRITLADMHRALDKAEKPVNMIKQYIREMEGQIVKAQEKLAQQVGLEKKCEALVAETEAVIEKRLRQANLAVERNEDEIAKMALHDKIVNERKLLSYKQQYEAAKEQTAYLQGKVQELKMKYEELQVKQQELIARASAAQAQEDHAANGFLRAEEKIWALEAKAKAGEGFAPSSQPNVSALLQAEVEKELEQLKAAKQ